ncbi:MAG: GNAT family N-acetyltransferase [Firmicutes bacterium]|nr:GNAT family N-acetyltransferase [Bacillota bacterium]
MYTGEKIRLREYRKEDAALAQAFINDPEVKRNLNPGIPYPLTLGDEEKWVASQTATTDLYNFAIETIDDARYIGGCGINQLDWKNKVATVGIFIGDRSCWNQGYGTDAMRVFLRFMFDQMNLNKVKLSVFSFNERAIAMYKKCGFQQEGRLRQELFRDGEYHDLIIMGILREEFNNEG